MTTLVIIGATGELGSKTVQAAAAVNAPTAWRGPIVATYRTSTPPSTASPARVRWLALDAADHKEVRSLLLSVAASVGTPPPTVLYCAVPKGANANAKSPDGLRPGIVDDVANCAEAVSMMGGRFVAVSTDLVFDGTLAPPALYDERSETRPVNAYGECKTEMERRLLALSGDVVIARTSLILTMDGGGDGDAKEGGEGVRGEMTFGKGVQFLVDCLRGRKGEIDIFSDELRSMSFADDLGLAMVELAQPDCPHRAGLIHMVSGETTNRWELSKLLARRLGLEAGLGVHAKSGLSSQSGLQNRPLNCGMSNAKWKTIMKTNIRGISERLG